LYQDAMQSSASTFASASSATLMSLSSGTEKLNQAHSAVLDFDFGNPAFWPP
jgi:hypothetical protein